MVEFAAGTAQGQGTVRPVVHGSDDNLYVEFYKNPVDGLDHVRMLIPGDKTFKPDFVADEHYQRRFARQWQLYKSEKDQFAGQTRLEEVAWIDPGTRDHFKGVGVHTVEQLAAVTDGNLQNLGHGARDFRDRAQREIQSLQDAKAFEQSEAEKAALQKDMEGMQAQIAELQALLDQQTDPKKGRKTANA